MGLHKGVMEGRIGSLQSLEGLTVSCFIHGFYESLS